jgi:tRNA A37 threonylcarbamoyladenosine biosynthesis protein TsaE
LDLALGELVEEDAVALVEWGELAADVLGEDVITVVITVTGDDDREIVVDGAAAKSRDLKLDAWEIR